MSEGEAPRLSSADRVLARLGPHAHRARPVLGGMVLQIVGVAVPVIYVVAKAKHEDAGGKITATSLGHGWHDASHSPAGIALLGASVLLFLFGSTLLARAFVSTRRGLLLALPVTALLGLLVLGAVALALVALVSMADSESSSDRWSVGEDPGGDQSRAGRRKRRWR